MFCLGKLVTFWSPVIGQAKVTGSLCAVVSSLGVTHPEIEIAVSAVCGNSAGLEGCLDERIGWTRKQELYERSGMTALLAACKQSDLEREAIRRSALPLVMKSVALFPGLRSEMKMIHGKEVERLEQYLFLEKILQEYDVTVLDLKSGWHNSAVFYMKQADIAVIVLPQNPGVWKQYKEDRRRLELKQEMILLGGSTGNSRYGPGQVSRTIFCNPKGTVGVVPWNAGYMDAMSEGRTMEFFLKNVHVRARDENYEFMEETRKTAETIRRRLFIS